MRTEQMGERTLVVIVGEGETVRSLLTRTEETELRRRLMDMGLF